MIKCTCPECKKEFDITDVIEPIRRRTIEDYSKKIIDEIYGDKSEETKKM